ncbi:hypothetical protein FACS1894174_03540 [Bacteroidia bacterium]|nr:hypothetical protein FACS1894174_03540 [Bacteroidia bacterium]
MPIIKSKSEENIKAAHLLVKENMYASSIHCAYYSCFQLSKYVLMGFCGLDYSLQDKESKGKDSHNYIPTKLADNLDAKSHLAFLDYNKYIAKLKNLRRKADYYNKEITPKEAQVALDSAIETIKILTNQYQII